MASSNFLISVRNATESNGAMTFGSEPGLTRYLIVPDGQDPDPVKHVIKRQEWLKQLRDRADAGSAPRNPQSPFSEYTRGDILVFVHGYNNSTQVVIDRHDLLQKNLRRCGFSGAIVSFDWPSAESSLNYLEDRSDARDTAAKLVKDGVKVLAFAQRDQHKDKCDIDVHLLGHSTGAYVIREAFYQASESRIIDRINWNVSQIVFIGGDIARSSMSSGDSKSQALFCHSVRITNYQNPSDTALKLSNVKRLGLHPRVGRVGIPGDAPESVVNVNVGRYWEMQDAPSEARGNWSHSWHFHDETFAEDLAATLAGDVDRNALFTRERREGELWLTKNRRANSTNQTDGDY